MPPRHWFPRPVDAGDTLPETGPREVVTTTAAFNDMSSTLKAVETTAVALADEDRLDLGPRPRQAKGSVWVLDATGGRFTKATYLPPPL